MSYQFVDFADISNTVLQACFRQEEFMEAVEQELVSLKLTRYTHQMLFGTNPLSSSTNSCAWYNSLKTWQYSSAAMTPWPESSGLPFFFRSWWVVQGQSYCLGGQPTYCRGCWWCRLSGLVGSPWGWKKPIEFRWHQARVRQLDDEEGRASTMRARTSMT